MAIVAARTVTEDIADALSALDELTRYAGDTRAHLMAALRQDEPLPGTLDGARNAAAITAACAGQMFDRIRAARTRVEPCD